jgi:indole-3-glycerol phosphate synthase
LTPGDEHQSTSAGASTTPTVLARILQSTLQTVADRKRERPLETIQAELDRVQESRLPRSFASALRAPGVGVIAEFKRRSPSAGELHEQPDLQRIVRAYEQGGACAISVLTDGPHFGGTLEDLRGARACCELPILRKDFIIDPYQLYEALLAGADAVLLIVAALEPQTLRSLHEQAIDIGLDVLVEVHDRAELALATAAGAQVIGINNRDLRDFSVDLRRTERLIGDVPAGLTVVSESGISEHEQLLRLGENGIQAVLVGETLMRAEDPSGALQSLLGSQPQR